ncbi:MAG: SdrD B-like domain-containing protein [Ferruginibacter sp.]
MKQISIFLMALLCLMATHVADAQVSGAVFKDFNGNGTKDANEPFAGGVVVKAYNTSDVLVNTVTTTAPLTGSTNYIFTPGAYPVRVEFTIPTSGATFCINPTFDKPGLGGSNYGSNVKFISATTSTANFAIYYPNEYVKSTNPFYYALRQTAGDPLAGSGLATTRTAVEGTPYTAGLATPGTTSPAQRTMANSFVGTCYGLAYSKQAAKLFTSASVKRHFGLGPLGSGGIYILDTALGTPSTPASVQFYNMDGNAHPTRSSGTGLPAYGSTTSFTVNSASSITYLGTIDPVTTYPSGFGVIGTNALRGMTGNPATASRDIAAFGQVGTIGLGDLEISEDGGFLYAVNLYNRRVYKLTLNSATAPTAVTAVDSFSLPNPPLRSTLGGGFATTYASDNADFYNGTKGFLRPYALKFYRGKLYVGAVTTGEKAGAATTTDNNTGNPEYTDLWAYVFEFDPATNTWTSAPLVQFPLNFNRGTNGDSYNETFQLWKNTSWTTTFTWSGGTNARLFYAQAMLTDIEFDPNDGSMILGLRDRIGDQVGHFQSQFSGTSLMVSTAMGDILRAYKTSSCTYEIESNAKEGASSSKAATAGAGTGQGPTNGEFYFRDNVYDAGGTRNANWHLNCTEGALAILPGTGQVMSTSMDPVDAWQQGIDWFDNTTGDNIRDHAMETAGSGGIDGNAGKGYGLGDIELLSYDAPLEIGNIVWNDANGNGIQDANESGIQNVTVELYADFNDDGIPDGAVLATATTNSTGNWYFNNGNITDGDPGTAGNQVGLKRNSKYIVRIGSADWNSTNGVGTNDLLNLQLTITDKLGNGESDFSDNDAALTIGATIVPQMRVTVGDFGFNSHNLDFGFKPLASLGDKVWLDNGVGGGTAADGIQNGTEPGVAGITVTLYHSGADAIAGNTDDYILATTVTDAYGIYFFDNLPASNYNVRFHLPANYTFSTQTNTADNENAGATTGSDANVTTGRTYNIVLSTGEIERDIDAGLIFVTPAATANVGDRVWLDINNNGIQDAGEQGVSGVTVTLYQNGVAVASTVTDANGNYLFTNVPAGSNYSVGFSLPPAFVFSPKDQGGNDNTDADVNATPGAANFGRTDNFTVVAGVTDLTLDAGLVPQSTLTASIGDFVWEDLDRDGIQDAGEPGIAGVSVALLDASGNPVDADGNSGNGIQPLTTVTDAFGNYQFNGIAPGSYIVAFTAPAGYTISAALQGADVAVDNNANPSTGRSNLVTVLAGDRISTIDAGMYNSTQALGATATLGNKVWRDDDKDGVQDASEPGVAGVTVELLDGSGNPVLSGGVAVKATTDANGNYLFANLAPGTYQVRFSNIPTGFAFTSPDLGGNDATDSDVNTVTGKTPTVTLVAGQNYVDFDAGIVQGTPAGLGSLGNKVFYDLNNDGLQGAGELGVANVTATLRSVGADGIAGNGDDVTVATTITNALGEYMFGGLAAGSYYVQFSTLPSGFTAATQNAGSDDALDSDGGTISVGISTTGVYNLVQGEDNLTVDLGLVAPANTNTLGNYVWFDANNDGLQDGTEKGVAGVTVTVLNSAGNIIDSDGNGANGIQPYTTTTDANGLYLFSGLPDGTYRVSFSTFPAGFALTAPSVTNTANGSDADYSYARTSSVVLGSGNRNDLSLDAGLISTRAALGNYVWNDLNGDGIQNAGEPGIAGVTVTLYAADGTTVIAATITDQNGGYLFANLTAGNYVVGFSTIPANVVFTTQDATAENLGTDSDVDPSTGKTAVITLAAGEVNLNVDAGVRTIIPATVGDYVWVDLDSDGLQDAGEPGVGGVIATLYNASNVKIGSAITDGKGQYLITNVTPGNGYYVIFSNLPGGSFTTQNVGGATAANNSNANASGQTLPFNVNAGDNIREIDAGIIGWPSSGVLPIALLSFTADKANTSAQLRWTTSQEINSSYMEVERSNNGVNFNSIARIAAAGFSTTARNYSLLDAQPSVGKNYYRLKLVSTDGKVQYSATRLVRFDANGNIMVYPNPAKNELNITFSDAWLNGTVGVQLINSIGQPVYNRQISNAVQTEQVDISHLASGIYTLKLQLNGSTTTYKKVQVIR